MPAAEYGIDYFRRFAADLLAVFLEAFLADDFRPFPFRRAVDFFAFARTDFFGVRTSLGIRLAIFFAFAPVTPPTTAPTAAPSGPTSDPAAAPAAAPPTKPSADGDSDSEPDSWACAIGRFLSGRANVTIARSATAGRERGAYPTQTRKGQW